MAAELGSPPARTIGGREGGTRLTGPQSINIIYWDKWYYSLIRQISSSLQNSQTFLSLGAMAAFPAKN